MTGSSELQPGRPVATEAPPARERWVLRVATLVYLIFLPLGHLEGFSIAGAGANWSDVLLGGLLAAAALELGLAAGGRFFGDAHQPDPSGPREGARGMAVLATACFAVFALWVLVGSRWSYHPDYATAKGLGLLALALGVAAVGWSGVEWRRAADAWLAGATASVLLVFMAGAVGPDALRMRLVHTGGTLQGLPFPRISGSFGHPNLFGDYLLLSGVLLWARWPSWFVRRPGGAVLVAGLVALTLILTASTAWLAAGVLLVCFGMDLRRRRAHDEGSRAGLWLLMAGGLSVAAAALVGVLFSVSLRVGPLVVTTGGIRPRIWSSAVEAFFAAPIAGVGASPYLAQAAEPLDPAHVVYLWDAHSTYLSVLGQYGLAGASFLAAGIVLLVRGVTVGGRLDSWSPDGRVRTALLGGFLAMAVHGTVIAGEDFRHWWAWAGLAALAVALPGAPGGEGSGST